MKRSVALLVSMLVLLVHPMEVLNFVVAEWELSDFVWWLDVDSESVLYDEYSLGYINSVEEMYEIEDDLWEWFGESLAEDSNNSLEYQNIDETVWDNISDKVIFDENFDDEEERELKNGEEYDNQVENVVDEYEEIENDEWDEEESDENDENIWEEDDVHELDESQMGLVDGQIWWNDADQIVELWNDGETGWEKSWETEWLKWNDDSESERTDFGDFEDNTVLEYVENTPKSWAQVMLDSNKVNILYQDNVVRYVDAQWNEYSMWTISISDASDTITILDRNLWATTNDISSIDSHGHLFQWWNNYWFANNWNINTSKKQISVSSYSWNNPYSNNAFVRWNASWMQQSYDVIQLWWWKIDSKSDNRWLDINESYKRQWPCPVWYHVPSIWEWTKLLNLYSNWMFDIWSDWLISSLSTIDNLGSDLYIPVTNYRRFKDGTLQSSGIMLWSSTISREGAYRLNIFDDNIYTNWYSEFAVAMPVRCFADIFDEGEMNNEEGILWSSTYNGVTVNVVAPVWSFPEGTILRITPIDTEEQNKEIESLIGKNVKVSVSFDISFLDKETGEEISPLTWKSVEVNFDYEGNNDFVSMSDRSVEVYHIDDKVEKWNKSKVKEMKTVSNGRWKLKIQADSFSIYTILGVEVELDLEPWITYGEWTITITDGIKRIVIKDRNVWATSNDITNTNSYGDYYQWWHMSWYAYSLAHNNIMGDGSYTQSTPTQWWTAEQQVQLCGEWYHVPTVDEWSDLLSMYQWLWNNISNFSSTFKIPKAWWRPQHPPKMENGGSIAYLWSDSSYVTINSNSVNVDGSVAIQVIPIRCFKDTIHTVIFDSNWWNEVEDLQVEDWSLVTKPTDPVRNWYSFQWWLVSWTDYFWNFETDIVTENITLIAEWNREWGESILSIEAPTIIQTSNMIYTEPFIQNIELNWWYFKVLDYIWSNTGWYTTISVSNLSWSKWWYIDKSNIYIKSHGVSLLTGEANDKVMVNDELLVYKNLSMPVQYFYRNEWEWAWKTGEYWDIPDIKVEIPAYQPDDTYNWTIIFTIYEN